MREKKPPYVPTRTCPHRWCKPLHTAPAPFVLAILAFYMWNNWLWLLIIVVAGTASFWVQKAVHVRRRPRSGPVSIQDVMQDSRDAPTPLDLEMEDAKYAGTGWRMLEVRKGWARVAVGCDMLLVLNIALCSVALFASPSRAATEVEHSTADVATYVSVLIGVAFFAFQAYAHKKATEPRKPKRAWLPAFMRTNT